jgi:putative oxidoreductase
LSFTVTLALRYLLVVLFLPLSALDKILNFNGAVAQARVDSIGRGILAGYCGIIALLSKQFWKPGDVWSAGSSRAHDPVLRLPQEPFLAGRLR